MADQDTSYTYENDPEREDVLEWFSRFMAAVTREDPTDLSAPAINPNRSEDRYRAFYLDENGQRITAFPSGGDFKYEDMKLLYEKAELGGLFVYPLGAQEALQVRTQSEQVLFALDLDPVYQDLRNVAPEPEEKELSFFKNILNTLFGLFEEERLRYEQEYEAAYRAYSYDASASNYVYAAKTQGLRTARDKEILHNSENFRQDGRSRLETMREQLKAPDLPAWRKTGIEARINCLEELLVGGKVYTADLVHQRITDMVVDNYVSSSKSVAAAVTADPQNLEHIRAAISNSTAVKNTVDTSMQTNQGTMLSCAFSDRTIEIMISDFAQEARDRLQAAKMLNDEGYDQTYGKSPADLDRLFRDERVTERFQQLCTARKMIPADQLKVERGERGVSEETRSEIVLDDPRVLANYQQLISQNQNGSSPSVEVKVPGSSSSPVLGNLN